MDLLDLKCQVRYDLDELASCIFREGGLVFTRDPAHSQELRLYFRPKMDLGWPTTGLFPLQLKHVRTIEAVRAH